MSKQPTGNQKKTSRSDSEYKPVEQALGAAPRVRVDDRPTVRVYETVLSHVHKYMGIDQEVNSARDMLEACIAEGITPRQKNQRALAESRSLLNRGAKERELQNCLFNSGLLESLTVNMKQEVTVKAGKETKAGRLDLLLGFDEDHIHVVELKRGIFKFLTRSREQSAACRDLRRQVEKYVLSYRDEKVKKQFLDGNGFLGKEIRFYIVAGRSMDVESWQIVLGSFDNDRQSHGVHISIKSWDGYLETLERLCA